MRALRRLWHWLPAALLLLALGLVAAPLRAEPIELAGRWFRLADAAPEHPALRQEVAHVAATGGRFVYEAEFRIEQGGRYVLDFKNSSVLARFRHRVFNARGALVAESSGGISGSEPNPYFLRHGRELALQPGAYRLHTELQSPFFLAQPEPYLDTEAHYRQAIKGGNALVLLGLGVFIGLGAYYACLALVRRRLADGLYVLFILGNLLYNASALLVVRELFGSSWFYLISVPILFSNIAYVLFVMVLLGIDAVSAPRLRRVGLALVGVMALFVVLALAQPSWSLELDRIGVGLFLVYGLSAGVVRVWQGDLLARWYLVANVGFFVTGLTAISLADLGGVHAFYIEHIGLAAVAIEVLLLALVLTHQFGLLQREKEHALSRAEQALRIASTDALTQLPNRYALDIELAELSEEGSLTFIDIDGLKHYNDHYGHARGDELLRSFAQELAARLGPHATLHRLGGDEFAATSRGGAVAHVEQMLAETIAALRTQGYELSGASFGSVHVRECDDRTQLKHMSDARMYEHKRRRRLRDSLQPTTT